MQWPPTEPEESSDSVPGHPLILVVEDNRDMQRQLRRLLQAEYGVVVAEDGNRGLELARGRTPDLVLTDVMMPGLDGFGLIRSDRCAALGPGDRPDSRRRALCPGGLAASAEGLAAGADD